MNVSYLKRQYELLGKDGESFAGYVTAEIERCDETIREALANAPQDHHGRPISYTVLKHVSPSGMNRSISVHVFDPDMGDMRCLNYSCALLLGRALDEKHQGVRVNGAGMDMGFALIYDLAAKVLGDGYAVTHRWL